MTQRAVQQADEPDKALCYVPCGARTAPASDAGRGSRVIRSPIAQSLSRRASPPPSLRRQRCSRVRTGQRRKRESIGRRFCKGTCYLRAVSGFCLIAYAVSSTERMAGKRLPGKSCRPALARAWFQPRGDRQMFSYGAVLPPGDSVDRAVRGRQHDVLRALRSVAPRLPPPREPG